MSADVIRLADHRPLPEAEAHKLANALECPHETDGNPFSVRVAHQPCCAPLRRLLRTRPVSEFHAAYGEVVNR